MGFGGRMDCCGQCVKYSMFVANFVIFVSCTLFFSTPPEPSTINKTNLTIQIGGAIVFGLGIWTAVDRSYMNELLGTNLYSGATYVLIATSALVCLVSLFGCLGAAKEVKCMLLTVSYFR